MRSSVQSRSLVLLLAAAACATSADEPVPVDGWEVVVQPVEAPVGSVLGGRFDFRFQTDLIDELQGVRRVAARSPDADELVRGARGRTLYVDTGLRSGRAGRVFVEVRQEPGGPVIWDRDYTVQSAGGDADRIMATLVHDIARDVAAVVRAAATSTAGTPGSGP